MAVAPGTKIELADLTTLATLANSKLGAAGPFQFLGRHNTVDHAVEAPTVAGWLNLDHLSRAGLLIGDVVINTRFPLTTQASKGWRLTAYPWNTPANWVNAQYRVGTFAEMAGTAPGNGTRWFTTDGLEVYLRRAGAWVRWDGPRAELLRIQTVLATHTRFNLLTSSTFQGYSRAAIVSERLLCPAPTMSSGAGRSIRRANYDDADVTHHPDPDAGGNHLNSLGDDALEREVLHFGGPGATWKMEMVPQLGHLQGMSGFQLVGGSGGHVRGRVTHMPDRLYPGRGHILRNGGVGAPGAFTVQLQGTMAPIATHYLQTGQAGSADRYFVDFHVYVNGFMGVGDCTISATLTLPTGWQWETQPLTDFMPTTFPFEGVPDVVYTMWVDVGLGNVSQEYTPAVSVDGRPIYTTGILRDDVMCLHLAGYSPPGFPQKATERCDRFAYYSPNADVKPFVNENILPSIGKRVPIGWQGDLQPDPGSFYPGFSGPSAEPTIEDAEQVEVAVNRRGGQQGECKTVPFVKHSAESTARLFGTSGETPRFMITEIVVQRRPVLIGDFYRMPKLPANPTAALTIQIGYYEVGEDGQFQSTGINIELPENVNVARWRGVMMVVSDRGLVYDCGEDDDVTVTALCGFPQGQTITTAANPPMRAWYYLETQRLLQAI